MNPTNMRRKAILIQYLFFSAAALLVIASMALVLFIGTQGLQVFKDESPAAFFFGTSWNQSTREYGVLPLLYSSIVTTILTLLFSVPLAILVSLFMVEVAPDRMRRVMRSTVELFAALPSVIFGLLGLTVVVPFVRQVFNAPLGNTVKAAGDQDRGRAGHAPRPGSCQRLCRRHDVDCAGHQRAGRGAE
jgi:phosphate transport system permease protein